MDLLPITRADMAAEISREIKMRQQVFPRWVSSGKLKQDESDRRIAIMEAVLHLLLLQGSGP